MSIPTPSRTLPTLHNLGSTVDPNIDVQAVVSDWFAKFTKAIGLKDVPAIVDLILDNGFWRDMLALTWDFRTFEGKDAVSKFLQGQLIVFDPQPDSFSLQRDLVQLQRPYEDIAWIQAFFKFDTNVGHASGVFRLVPLPDRSWKAHVVYTNLEDLKGFPESTGRLRNFQSDRGEWASKREREKEFLDQEPSVIIVGGGQSGLDVAARLKMLGVNALVVERNQRIGDNWRKRYAALCLHDPVWYDHMPYLPFPPSWPVYTPAMKLADWLESYAHSMELNVWTSATVVSIEKETGDSGKHWSVHVEREDGRKRVFKVDHVVLALGIGGGLPRNPNIPGQDEFKGQILHSTEHESTTDHVGKKVVVVGSCTSAHDICADYVNHGVDVAMVQRGPTYIMSTKEGMPRQMALYWEGGPPTDVADRVNASYPAHVAKLVHQRVTKDIAEADKELLDGLRRVGFKLTFGEDGSGFFRLAFNKAGGYYFDVGASQLLIDGKIKLKSDGPIKKFTPNGLLFEDGSTLDADVVVFATGYGDSRNASFDLIKNTDLHDKVRQIWGMDDEGEICGSYREIGKPNEEGKAIAGLWCIMGNLALCRFHSKHVALQIKAYQENIFGVRYSSGY
ncbi:FAD/NAD(P)-binding domain-containing protein [Boletus reticuloceps]|uniref:FAD/NAD(P)-binding domain-containing protein n=1 Tax=Boletus reticuloceps TaxID=495285 RepID=A0A8I2YN54_9AGAM|nr:FAD/NAD(P)-binding domain-containing protein [Boletus reticuloceps]